MNRIGILILTLITAACGKKSEKSASEIVNTECSPFFTFDHLDHFQISIEKDSVSNFHFNERGIPLTALEIKLSDILVSDSSMTLSDTTRFSEIEKLGYRKLPVDKSEFGKINQLFCEGFLPEEIKVNLCLPAFRDILIFKSQNHIVGFAKLCFECNQSMIVGTNKQTYQFGQFGEFEKLADVLKAEKYY